jgi:hypothetical protein
VPTSALDPRNLGDLDEQTADGLRSAPALVATLQPGDALHIPVAWWHYIEAGHTDAAAATLQNDVLSLALNIPVLTADAEDTMAPVPVSSDGLDGSRLPAYSYSKPS